LLSNNRWLWKEDEESVHRYQLPSVKSSLSTAIFFASHIVSFLVIIVISDAATVTLINAIINFIIVIAIFTVTLTGGIVPL